MTTELFLQLFANDYGSIDNVSILIFYNITLIWCILLLSLINAKSWLTFPFIIFSIYFAFGFSTATTENVPQYGTQSQKEMLLICLQHEKNNELSEEEQKHISNTINDIMETCYKHHLNNEEYVKKLLEEQKQELKDKEVLDSLNKMMAN